MKNARRSSRDKTSVKIPKTEVREYREREYRDHIAGYPDFKAVAEQKFQRKMFETKIVTQHDLIMILKGKQC